MKKTLFLLFVIPSIIVGGLFIPKDSYAIPAFARQVGRDCTFCHIAFPKLNEMGRIFRSNGYRFAEDGGWKEIKDWSTLPVALEVEVEGKYNKDKASGVKTESSDIVVEEVEVMMGAPMGKTGRVSVFGAIAVEQEADGTYEAAIGPAFVQVNDLLGQTGHGMLNLRAGQWEVALPFLSSWQGVVKNSYLAERTLTVFVPEQRAVELNGSVLAPEESRRPTYRYSFGISREDVNSQNKFKGYYGTFATTFKEKYNLGVIYRHGQEAGTPDIDVNKFGVAGEVELGPAIFTAGYFNSDPESGNYVNNYLAEILYLPLPKLILGARYDIAKEGGKEDAKASTLTVRYNIISNVFTQLEYRNLKDDDSIIGSNEREDRVRFYLVSLF